mgnify:CR=1 FL=1
MNDFSDKRDNFCLPEHEENLLDLAYNEMMDFSGLDLGFIENVLELAESDDECYESVCRWIQCNNTVQRKYYEEEMTKILAKNNRL